jgi:hypothetical protein
MDICSNSWISSWMPGSTNTIKILTPSEIEFYLNFKENREKNMF